MTTSRLLYKLCKFNPLAFHITSVTTPRNRHSSGMMILLHENQLGRTRTLRILLIASVTTQEFHCVLSVPTTSIWNTSKFTPHWSEAIINTVISKKIEEQCRQYWGRNVTRLWVLLDTRNVIYIMYLAQNYY